MGAGKLLWGWYKEGVPPIWVPLQVDADGKVIVDMSAIGLNDLGDVSVAAPGDHNIIDWDAATSKWVKRALGDMGAHHARHEFGGADPADFTDWLKQDRAVIVHENGSNFGNATLWTQSLSAGMTFVQALVASYLITDATANRTGYLYTTERAFVYDWFHWIALTPGGASDFLAWLWISNTLGASTPVVGQKCAGFKLEDGKIYAYSADGVGEETTEIGDLDVNNNSYLLKNNADSVDFYLNGVLETTHSVRYPGAVAQQVKMYLTNKANVAKSLYIRTIGIRRI